MNDPAAPVRENPKSRSGSEVRQRGGLIAFRVSESERAELEKKADRVGLTLGSYIRQCALSAPQTRAVRRPPIDQKILAQLLGQLGRVGGNIHQIAKHMNFGTGVLDDEVRTALTAFEGAAASIMEAMGRGPR